MSIINKMLKDIEQRKPQPDIELEKTIEVQPIYDYVTMGKRIGFVLLLCSIVVLAYVLIPQKSAIDAPLEITPPITLAPTEETVDSVLVISESEQHSSQAVAVNQIDRSTISDAATLPQAQNYPIDVQKTASEPAQVAKISTVKNETAIIERKAQAIKIDTPRKSSVVTATAAQAKINVRQISTQERANNWFNKGKEAFKFGLIEDAIIDLDKALTLMPLHIDARSLLAAAYYGRGQLAQADAILRQGLRFSPDVMRWRVLLAKILTEQQSYESVLPILSSQFERYANIDFWILKGTAAQQLGENDIALQCFRKLTQLQPEQAKWWLALASASEIAADQYNARRYYMTALQLGGLSPSSQDHAQQRLEYLGDSK